MGKGRKRQRQTDRQGKRGRARGKERQIDSLTETDSHREGGAHIHTRARAQFPIICINLKSYIISYIWQLDHLSLAIFRIETITEEGEEWIYRERLRVDTE